ncbi:cupin domain-containing protein [Candidatus Woesearchaeota archaeon]|nr:cupin domain-containing protein [Candidatus Woesearchaeota archaeon]
MNYESLIKPPMSQTLKSGRVVLQPGEEIGEHTTSSKEELIIVLNGELLLRKGREEIVLKKGNSHYIPPEVIHNVINKSGAESEYIYVVCLLKD